MLTPSAASSLQRCARQASRTAAAASAAVPVPIPMPPRITESQPWTTDCSGVSPTFRPCTMKSIQLTTSRTLSGRLPLDSSSVKKWMNLSSTGRKRTYPSAACSFSCRMTRRSSSMPMDEGTKISVIRLRRAGDSSFFPKSPPGFIVAIMRKFSCPVISSILLLPFSGSVRPRLLSNTLFRRSRHASSARLISSSMKWWPCRMAVTNGPSDQAKSFPSAASSAGVGRRLPRKSELSVCWWQFTMLSSVCARKAYSWQIVVLPPPVSPTSTNGSLKCMHHPTSVNNRFRLCVQTRDWMGMSSVMLPSRSSSGLNVLLAKQSYSFSSSILTPHSFSIVSFTTCRSSGRRHRSPKSMKPWWARSEMNPRLRLAHLNRSRGVMNPCFPAKSWLFCRNTCKWTITRIIFVTQDVGSLKRCSRIVCSSSLGMSSTCSSAKRLRKARDKTFRPPYNMGGF
mmetsp:Transcript_110329/g.191127  ORF Transcript_110329/g.191127 Transcript_110329/m.191127 type:complete len:453 (+) Transcript_110329:2433-3791(+)